MVMSGKIDRSAPYTQNEADEEYIEYKEALQERKRDILCGG